VSLAGVSAALLRGLKLAEVAVCDSRSEAGLGWPAQTTSRGGRAGPRGWLRRVRCHARSRRRSGLPERPGMSRKRHGARVEMARSSNMLGLQDEQRHADDGGQSSI